ncbi:hypothetical protein EHS25_004653 [Saitozyma podzolica]|uniref:Uncharacterized protein n=1 Tax=Saitozyma podzolica TaxID=1890683 RepID=A0A427YUS6_9TREE|nr:hypothetical protein EHS25_004653 [Saitozyma podzolica]
MPASTRRQPNATTPALASTTPITSSANGGGRGNGNGHLDSEASAISTGKASSISTSRRRHPTTARTSAPDLDDTPPADSSEEMFAPSGLRGRNVEDVHELEEKGLLMSRQSSGTGSDGGTGVRGLSLVEKEKEKERDRAKEKGKGKGKDKGRLEMVTQDEDGPVGLNNRRDRNAFILLVVLYLLQGIPLGLTFGTLPFLLKSHLSYSQLAVFALATWPYSLKLLWSPIVDAWFVPKWGGERAGSSPCRPSSGWGCGSLVGKWRGGSQRLIMAAATQDIAVDGWALTLLSPPNLSYASTAQTIGLGIGNALAFTVFLAFNSVEFSNKYFRSKPLDYGLVSLGGYMRFWAIIFVLVTLWLAFFKVEDPVGEDDPDMDVKKVYKVMWSIVQLKNIQSFLLVHVICKIGFQVNDGVTGLKLLEKGLSKEDLAVAVLLDFPAQMIAGWLAARWARPTHNRHALSGGGTGQVLRPWVAAFWARLAMAGFATFVVWAFPVGRKVGSGYFALVVATTLLSSLTSTVQFVGITAFHTQIADPLIGGTYMTLLNTISNLGGTWPRPLVLRGVDMLTSATCTVPLQHLGTKSVGRLGECGRVLPHEWDLCGFGGELARAVHPADGAEASM